MELPDLFCTAMRELLGEEYPGFIDSMGQPPHTALRVNTLKITPDRFREISPFALEKVNWTAKGFYYDAAGDNPSRHSYYLAGLYYIQEPSAMIPATLLPVSPGDRVLDLCAAPGGKATELAAKLEGSGLLVANDISASRAMALVKNLQMAGVRNAVVTAETPRHLAETLPSFFDRVLVDAPCSGEGMFRKDPRMVRDWLEHGPEYYARLQRQILSEAYCLLRPGGYMVYSTCTFSPLEDEGAVRWFLCEHPDMRICPVERQEGFCEGRPDWTDGGGEDLRHCVRVFPHRARGEGHFAVLLRKAENGPAGESVPVGKCALTQGEEGRSVGRKARRRKAGRDAAQKGKGRQGSSSGDLPSFLCHVRGLSLESGVLSRRGGSCSLLTPEMEAVTGLRTICSGLILGKQRKERFEPSVQLALALRPEDHPQVIDLPARDERVMRYLKGETLQMEEKTSRGYILFCVDGYPLGWCMGSGTGLLKNKYYPGWRM